MSVQRFRKFSVVQYTDCMDRVEPPLLLVETDDHCVEFEIPEPIRVELIEALQSMGDK